MASIIEQSGDEKMIRLVTTKGRVTLAAGPIMAHHAAALKGKSAKATPAEVVKSLAWAQAQLAALLEIPAEQVVIGFDFEKGEFTGLTITN